MGAHPRLCCVAREARALTHSGRRLTDRVRLATRSETAQVLLHSHSEFALARQGSLPICHNADPVGARSVENEGAIVVQRCSLSSRTLAGEQPTAIRFDRPLTNAMDITRLSVAERDVALLIAQGLRNREIARVLYRSEKTVEKHVRRIFEKLAIHQLDDRFDRRVLVCRAVLASEVTSPVVAVANSIVALGGS